MRKIHPPGSPPDWWGMWEHLDAVSARLSFALPASWIMSAFAFVYALSTQPNTPESATALFTCFVLVANSLRLAYKKQVADTGGDIFFGPTREAEFPTPVSENLEHWYNVPIKVLKPLIPCACVALAYNYGKCDAFALPIGLVVWYFAMNHFPHI